MFIWNNQKTPASGRGGRERTSRVKGGTGRRGWENNTMIVLPK